MSILIMVLVFFAILISANIYMAKRFTFYFTFEKATLFYILFPLITVFMIGGVMGATNATSSLGHFVFIIGAVLMGFILYLLVSTILVDLLSLVWKTKPLYYGLIAISIASLISIYGIWNATNIQLTEVDITLKKLQKPIRAAHLTDTHLGHFRGSKNLQKIVDIINENKVDVVFFTGDLLDSKIQLKPETMLPLKNLNAPIYFVEGNHDEYTGVDAIKNYLKSIGVNVLENKVANWAELQIIGLTFMVADSESVSPHANSKGPNIKKVLGQLHLNHSKPTVLLHHGPTGVKYANEAGVDLYLAGHTHAGQLWPATHVAKLMFEYNKGLHNYKGTQVYVSQGTGTFGPPMRVGTQSELTFLNLKPE